MAVALGYEMAGFMLAGFSEVISLLWMVVFGLLWLKTRHPRYMFVTAGLIAGIIVVVIAPGNAVRAAQLPERLSVGFALSLATRESLSFIADAVIHQPLAAVLAFLVGYCCPMHRFLRRRLLTATLVIIAALAVMIVSLTVPLIGTNALAPRHFTLHAFVLSVTLFILGVLCAGSRSSSFS